MAIAARRRAHQEAVAFGEDALAVAGLDMRMADDNVMLLAGVNHALHLREQFRVLVLARNAELLSEIAFADQDRADALHLFQHRVEVLDPAHVLDLQDTEDLAVRIEWP